MGTLNFFFFQRLVHTASSSLVFVLYRFFIQPSSPSSSSSSSPLSSSSLRRRPCLSYLLTLGITTFGFGKTKTSLKRKIQRPQEFFFQEASSLPPLKTLTSRRLSLSLSLSSKGYTFLFSCFCEQKLLSPRTKTNRSDSLLSSFLFAFFVCRVC